jgi:hypothetical protein
MPHQIRTSERRSFRGCRRRWDWAYRQGYAPTEEPRPLEFGRAFHVAMEVLYDPALWNISTAEEKLLNARIAFKTECELQRTRYQEETGTVRLDFDQKNDYDERITLGLGMLDYYVDNVHNVDDHWLKPVKVEIEFDVPLEDQWGNSIRCWNSPECGQIHANDGGDNVVTHGGRVDAIVEDIIHGGYWIIDWKTAQELRATEAMLEMDDQICTYCWALRDKLNIDIRGFIYVEIRKAYPQPPKRLKRTRNGCAYSTDKRMPTTAALFRETVVNNDPDAYAAGCYDEFIDYLENDKDAAKFHQRFTIHKTPKQLTNIGKNVALEAQDMVESGIRLYPAPGRFSCPTCAYRSPCEMKFNDEDYVYTLDTLFRKVK